MNNRYKNALNYSVNNVCIFNQFFFRIRHACSYNNKQIKNFINNEQIIVHIVKNKSIQKYTELCQ